MALFSSAKWPKRIAAILLICASGWAINKYILHGSKTVTQSQTVTSGQLGTSNESSAPTTDKRANIPKLNSAAGKGTRIDLWGAAWNAQAGVAYAMGGTSTASGSLFDSAGIDAKFVWQDDFDKTYAAFLSNANDIKKDPNTIPIGMLIMGDGYPGGTVSLKELPKKLGKEFVPIVITIAGRSDGEDGFWGPKEWKGNPKLCLGHTVCFKVLDGDGNIPMKWAADNGIPINANPKYLDRNALNVIPATDYVDAGNKYITGYTEKRIIVKNGKTYPDSVVEVGVDAYASWTPVDVTVAEKKGGLLKLASTHEYTGQMPCVLFMLKAWVYSSAEHQAAVKALVKAIGKGGDQVRSFPDALDFAGKVEALWYGNQPDKPGPYWVKYYKGVEEKDATGMRVALGGSKAFNLADAANTLGKGKDGIDRYKMSYNYFGGQQQKFWPKEMTGMMAYTDVVDKSFITSVLDNNDDLAQEKTEEELAPATQGDITDEVSSKPYNIQFETGKAILMPSSKSQLAEIFQSKVISGGLKLGIYGHTDNTGTDAINNPLSKARAEAVANYLRGLHLKVDNDNVKGLGSTQPIDGIDASDPRNKCVEIVQGT